MVQSPKYTPKRILLTGGAGFIGSHVADRITADFPELELLVVYDIMDYCAHDFHLDHVREKMGDRFKLVEGDILSADLLRYVLKENRIDTILHLAAQSHVDNSFSSPLLFTKVNCLGTQTLLMVCQELGGQIKRFIHMSTDEVMGESPHEEEEVTFDETALLNPTNPYSASKAAAEQYCIGYHRSHKLPIVIVRGNNVYGPRQWPEKLIPKFTCMLRAGQQKLPLHGNGLHQRSFMYVTDTARALCLLAMYGQVGHVYNIGTDFEVTNVDVAREILKRFGIEDADRQAQYLDYVRDRDFNDRRYNIDSKKLRNLTGWKPEVDFQTGLDRTVSWYKENAHRYGDLGDVLVPHPKYIGKQH